MSGGGPLRFAQVMSLDFGEFLRLLPTALAKHSYTREDRRIHIVDGTCRIEIACTPEPMLRIASIELPSSRVEFSFEGCSEEQCRQFMEGFLRHYQRGGG